MASPSVEGIPPTFGPGWEFYRCPIKSYYLSFKRNTAEVFLLTDIESMGSVTGFWLLSGFSPYSSLGNVLCLVPMDGGWNYFGTSRGGIHRMPKESVLRIPEMSCGVLEF